MENTYSEINSEYLKNNSSWHLEDSEWKASQILSILNKNRLNVHTIAEVGCGAGEILRQLKTRLTPDTIEFSGYDIAPDLEFFWKEREGKRLHFYRENLLDKDVHFDLLLLIDVFEHVEDYLSFIKQCSTKATYKIYHIPLDISVTSVIRNMLIKTRRSVGHLHHFTKDTALATIEDCGQQIIDFQYTSGALELKKIFRTRLLNIPRRILFKINKDLAVTLFGGYSLIVLAR